VGDPRRAGAAQGAAIADRIVSHSVTAIRDALGRQSQK
jgi:creatinine amidohydrolase/Fe(II)-dependent formamide hydrolase-like protein